ncbi:MAG: DUF3800 domain-containing protein [Aequorivita sp.]
MVYFCYIDESGTPQIPGNTSHYVLVGISIPISKWKFCEQRIYTTKRKYNLIGCEIHTGWIVRKYIEQSKIPNFEQLDYATRRHEVSKIRKRELLKLQKSQNKAHYKQTRKNYRHTEAYVHLTHSERMAFIEEIADLVGSFSFARLFGEAIDKIHFDPNKSKLSIDEQGLEQLVSRFEQYLKIRSKSLNDDGTYGALIHDNNDTVSKRHTDLMKRFHRYGTLWTSVEKIIETPLFVNSELTSLVQIADLCCYSIRRYLENNESNLFDRIKKKIDRKNGKIVGIRHFSDSSCKCELCV